MVAYCDVASLAIYLGRDLTDAETDGAPLAAAAASDFIDRYTGKTWQGTTISGELQTVYSTTVRLDRTPVASVTTVTARSLVVGETPRVLVAGTGYELLDALDGVLLVSESRGTVLTVTYVVSTTIPPAIALAADIIAASYLIAAPAASLQTRGIQKLEAGTAKITYDPIDHEMTVPPTAYALLAGYRPSVVFA